MLTTAGPTFASIGANPSLGMPGGTAATGGRSGAGPGAGAGTGAGCATGGRTPCALAPGDVPSLPLHERSATETKPTRKHLRDMDIDLRTHGKSAAARRPSDSSNPNARFIHCTAAPLAPFTR